MYESHYGLNAKPFQLTPDPKFFSPVNGTNVPYPIYSMDSRKAKALLLLLVISEPVKLLLPIAC